MKKTEAECCEVTFVHDDIVRQIGTKMPEEELLKELADFYKVFGDSTRIKILCGKEPQRRKDRILFAG